MDKIFILRMVAAYKEEYAVESDLSGISSRIIDDMARLKQIDKALYNTLFEQTAVVKQKLIYSLIDDKLNIPEILNEEIRLINENLHEDDVIYEGVLLFSTIMSIPVLLTFFSVKYRLEVRKILNNILTTVSDLSKDKDAKLRFKIVENILEKNLFQCTGTCALEVDNHKPTFKLPFSKTDHNIPFSSSLKDSERKRLSKLIYGKSIAAIRPTFMSNSDDDIRKEQCLIGCYLDGITSVIAELTSNYINCMETTGGGKIIIEPGQGISTLLSHPASMDCEYIYDKLKDINDDFFDLLKIKSNQYKDPSFVKEWINILDDKIGKTKNNQHLKPIGRHPVPYQQQFSRTKTGNFNSSSLYQSNKIDYNK